MPSFLSALRASPELARWVAIHDAHRGWGLCSPEGEAWWPPERADTEEAAQGMWLDNTLKERRPC